MSTASQPDRETGRERERRGNGVGTLYNSSKTIYVMCIRELMKTIDKDVFMLFSSLC